MEEYLFQTLGWFSINRRVVKHSAVIVPSPSSVRLNYFPVLSAFRGSLTLSEVF